MMQKINSGASLRDAILRLESKQFDEAIMLREQFNLTYESIKPVNLIKSIFKQAIESRDLKDNLLNTSVGLTAGYFFKILFQGLTKSPIKKLLGTAIMFGITNVIAKNPETVKSFGSGFLKMILSKLSKKE